MIYTNHRILFIAIFLILFTGCPVHEDEDQYNGDYVIVQQRVAEAHGYTMIRKISVPKQVQMIKDITSTIKQNNIEAEMIRPPDYKFYFENDENAAASNRVIYDLWISPNQNQVEIIVESQSTYVQLDKTQSAKLFELLTGEALSGQVKK
ncbi:hypothetical protein [Paenibacillus sp. MABNR03]|uniref:hypothetical protein n=1 Tax=Paenibacillus sp. MABNR03 TaxID=3142626 RepID=UPI003D2BBEA5